MDSRACRQEAKSRGDHDDVLSSTVSAASILCRSLGAVVGQHRFSDNARGQNVFRPSDICGMKLESKRPASQLDDFIA